MISKRLFFTLIFSVSFLVNSDAIRRGGSSKSRAGSSSYSAGNLSNESPQDPGRAILAIIFMILSCGGGIGWKIYRCYRKEKRRKCLQTRIPYPNNIYKNSMSTSIGDQLNDTSLSEKRFTLVSLSDQNTFNQIQVQKTIVPSEDINISPRTGWIGTLL